MKAITAESSGGLRTELPEHPGRIAGDDRVGLRPSSHARFRPHERPFADGDAAEDDGAATDRGASADPCLDDTPIVGSLWFPSRSPPPDNGR